MSNSSERRLESGGSEIGEKDLENGILLYDVDEYDGEPSQEDIDYEEDPYIFALNPSPLDP